MQKKFDKSKNDKKFDKTKGKGKKPYQKKDVKPEGKQELGDINDTNYYFSDPNLLSQVTNMSFNEYMGVPVDFNSEVSGVKYVERITNVCSFFMNPSVQPTGYEADARYASINVVGFKNYLLLSANNAKTTSYAPQDVTCLILAIGQVLAMYSYLRRAFGVLYLVNQRNRSYPELLFKAMGIDFADFRENVAKYRIEFNQLIAMFDRIPFFDDIWYFDKCKKMFDYIYVDEDTPLAQSYLFVPQTTWTIDEAYNPQGTGLVTTEVVSKTETKTFNQYLNIFNDMINALATSTTFNAVFSDVLRVIQNGKGKTIMLEVLSEAYSTTPVINQEIRHWINNAKFLHLADDKDAFPGSLGVGATNYNDVASLANQNGILYNPIFSISGSDHNATAIPNNLMYKPMIVPFENDIVNFDSMDPSIDDRVAATRLAVRGKILLTDSTQSGMVFATLMDAAVGDYFCSGMLVYDDVVNDPLLIENNTVFIDTGTPTSAITAIAITDKLSKLKYAPRIHFVKQTNTANINRCEAVIGDLTYYTLLDYKYMHKFKDVEALTLFAIMPKG